MKRHDPADDGGPRGGAESLGNTRWQRREHLRTLEAIVYDGWDVPPEVFATVPKSLYEISRDPMQSTRDRIRASEAIAHLVQHRADAAIQLDRIMRLDHGEATDRTEIVGSLTDAQIEAVAASLRPDPPTDAQKTNQPKRGRKRGA